MRQNIRGYADGVIGIEVSDTGCGIPAENLGRIFEPFFTTKEIGKGTGLGLAIIRESVEQHHGSIEVKSAPGAGTTFTIRIPVCIEPPAVGGEEER